MTLPEFDVTALEFGRFPYKFSTAKIQRRLTGSSLTDGPGFSFYKQRPIAIQMKLYLRYGWVENSSRDEIQN